MKIAIVDDNSSYRRKIGILLKSYLDKRQLEAQVEFFGSGEALLSSDVASLDILLLDVEMGQINGIQTARKVRLINNTVLIIMVTSFVKYSVEAFEVDTFRYLVKNRMDEYFEYYMDELFDRMHIAKKMLTFNFVEGQFSFEEKQLEYIESNGHRIDFHLVTPGGKSFHLYDKLDAIEAVLDPDVFMRFHKSYIANMFHIKYIRDRCVYLHSGVALPIPKSKYRMVKERFSFYKGSL